MPRAIRIHAFGDSSVMRYEEIPDPTPKPGEAVVTIEAVGVNFLDVYHRSGVYPIPLPITLGQEGAGVVRSVGEGVTSVKVGDCVAWTGVFGSYAEVNVIPANRLVHVPVGLQTKQAAAIMLQGITAHYLATSTYPLKSGDTALVHAGAGGVGLLLTQIAKMRGARVITTVSTPEKAQLSRQAGAVEVLDYPDDAAAFGARIKELTDGGVAAVYDGVGADTFDASLASLAVRGTLALFGAASGPVPPFDPQRLNAAGSLFLTRPTLVHYTRTPDEFAWRAGELLDAIAIGTITVTVSERYRLEDAEQAHRDLQGRKTMGSVVLVP